MIRRTLRFSAHARARMSQRGINERQVLIIVNGGHRELEGTSTISDEPWRYSGIADGRRITVVATESETGIMVITAY